MTRTIYRITIAVIVAFALTAGAGVAAAGDYHDKPKKEKPKKEKPTKKKVTVCHVPPGNPSNAHLISVSKQGWKNGHKKNHKGDFLVKDWKDKKKCKNFGKHHKY